MIAGLLFVALAASPDRINAGPLSLEMRISRTAQLFHVVDQISQWSPYCHDQYLAAIGRLSTEDEAKLAQYRAIRQRYGWGRGLEQTFYSDDGVEAALAKAVAAQRLDAEAAATVKQVLEQFAGRIDALVTEETPRLRAFRDELGQRRGELEAFATKAAAFSGVAALSVPVFLVANPSDNDTGGGFNGERLTLEVPRKADPLVSLVFHELMHAFIAGKRQLLRDSAARLDGIDSETIEEALIYPVPSCFETASYKELKSRVAEDFAAQKPLADPYVRFNRFGLGLRPLICDALAKGRTIEEVLPRALDVLAGLRAVSPAPMPHFFSAGPGWQTLGKRVQLTLSTNHRPDHYEEILKRRSAGDVLVLLFALDDNDRQVPAAFGDLLPIKLGEVESRLRAGKTVEMAGAARGLATVLLAAPTTAGLQQLIATSALLSLP
jgi:hypothetical protein